MGGNKLMMSMAATPGPCYGASNNGCSGNQALPDSPVQLRGDLMLRPYSRASTASFASQVRLSQSSFTSPNGSDPFVRPEGITMRSTLPRENCFRQMTIRNTWASRICETFVRYEPGDQADWRGRKDASAITSSGFWSVGDATLGNGLTAATPPSSSSIWSPIQYRTQSASILHKLSRETGMNNGIKSNTQAEPTRRRLRAQKSDSA
jgi:hypothetical protein